MWRTGLVSLVLVFLGCDSGPPSAPHCEGVAEALAVLRPPPTELGAAEVSSANLRGWIERLTAPELRGRHATSGEARTVAAMLAEHMAILGLEAPYGDGSYCQGIPLLDGDGHNVVGHLEGDGFEAAAVLLGAHYDGQGLHPSGLVYPGADDNASGVAALVETARLALRRRWPFDLVFAALTAEEIGQAGAAAWVAEPSVALKNLRLMINFDMVGRPWPASPASAIGYESMGDDVEPAVEKLRQAAAASGIEIRRLSELFAEEDLRSDSAVFRRHVPTLYLSTGLHADHHQRTDTPDKVDTDQIARTVELTLTLLERLANNVSD